MADSYIDYFEVGEYGSHFVTEAKKLSGASTLVNVDALWARVEAAAATVASELQNAGISRSDLRQGSGGTAAASAVVSDVIGRFFSGVRSLPKAAGVDAAAFFPGNKLGNLSDLKPADMRAKANQVLLGFAATANAGIAQLQPWQTELTAARDALDAELTGKGSATTTKLVGSAALAEARESFLTIYNKVAKPLVKGLLADLGKSGDYELYFLDLQVNEGGVSKKKDPAPKGDAGAPA